MKHAVALRLLSCMLPVTYASQAARRVAGSRRKAEPGPSAQRRCVPAVSEAQPGWRAPGAASARG
eukprot:2364837-Prymnesium_polylepis.1